MLIKNKGAGRRTALGRHSRQSQSLTDSLPAHSGNLLETVADVLLLCCDLSTNESIPYDRHVKEDSRCYTARMGNLTVLCTTSLHLFPGR